MSTKLTQVEVRRELAADEVNSTAEQQFVGGQMALNEDDFENRVAYEHHLLIVQLEARERAFPTLFNQSHVRDFG